MTINKAIISVNGLITSESEAKISPLDRGLMLGDQIFEVFVGFGNQVLDIDRHLKRLRYSAELHQLELPWSDKELAFEIKAVTAHANFAKSYIKLLITRGIGTGILPPKNQEYTKIVYVFPATIQDPKIYKDGLALKHKQKAYTNRGAQSKTNNYAESVSALKKAHAEGFQDVLWSNSDGEITESSIANIFFIGREGDQVEIVTPSAYSGILVGITRKTILDLLNNAGIRAAEQIIYADEIPRFDEASITSSVRGLVPINRISNHKLHTTRPTSTFHHIERLFLTWIKTELGFEVDWNTGLKT